MLELTSLAFSGLLYVLDGELERDVRSNQPRIVRVLTTTDQTALPPELSWVDIGVDISASPPSPPEDMPISSLSAGEHPTLAVLNDSIKLIGAMSGIPVNREYDELIAKRLNQRIAGRSRRLIKS